MHIYLFEKRETRKREGEIERKKREEWRSRPSSPNVKERGRERERERKSGTSEYLNAGCTFSGTVYCHTSRVPFAPRFISRCYYIII